jgi:hypothetical protein
MLSKLFATALMAAVFLLLLPASAVADDEFGGTWVSMSATPDTRDCGLYGICPFLGPWSSADPTLFSHNTYSWSYYEDSYEGALATPQPDGTLENASFTASGQVSSSQYSLGAELSMAVSNWGPLDNWSGTEYFSASAQAELWLTDPNFVYNGTNGLPQNGYLALTLQVDGSGQFVLYYYNQYYGGLPQSVGFNSNPGTITLDVPFSLCDPINALCGPPDIELALRLSDELGPVWQDENLSASYSSDYLDTITVESAKVYDNNGNFVPGALRFDGLPAPEPGSSILLLTMLGGLGVAHRLRRRRT